MFEVENLKYATLATVSRCGMVWFSEDIVNLDMIFYHYLMRLSQPNYDDTMNYTSNANGQTEQFDKKSDYLTVVRQKCVEAIRPLFVVPGFVSQAIEIASKYNHVMDFTRIRVVVCKPNAIA